MALIRGEDPTFRDKVYAKATLRDWHEHNRQVLRGDIIGITDQNTSTTKNCIVKANQTACHDFEDSTDQTKSRSRHIHYWQCELEQAIRDIDGEIKLVDKVREQLRNAIDTLKIPEYITKECLDIREGRMQSDYIFDEPQKELVEEADLIENVKRLQNDLLRELERQKDVDLAAKEALERDWSLKKIAYKYETEIAGLQTKSENVKDTPGATKLSEGQSNVPSWEQNTINTLNNYKNATDNSKALRAKTEACLLNASRDLRTQDIKVNKALSDRIAATRQVKFELENQLKTTLQKIAETENIVDTLHDEIMKIDQRMRVVQTRLTIKNCRPNVENCREGALESLVNEVKDLNDSRTLLKNRSVETELLRARLIEERGRLENEIIVKNNTIFLDDKRCLYIRSHFQSAEKLCGY